MPQFSIADRKIWIAGLIMVMAGAVLYGLLSSPFGWAFWSVFLVTVAALISFTGLAGIRLVQRGGGFGYVSGGLLSLVCLCAFSFTLIGAADYRLLVSRDLPDGISASAWQEDLKFLADAMVSRHPDVYSLVDQEGFQRQVTQLNLAIPTLRPAEIVSEMMKLVALPNDGHTLISPFHPSIDFHFFPLKIYRFRDGWYVTDAARGYGDAIGQRLIQIDDTPIEEIYARIDAVIGAENKWHTWERFAIWGMAAELLEAQGVLESAESATFLLEGDDGKRLSIQLNAQPFYTWVFWYFLMPVDQNAPHAVSNFRSKNFWFEFQPEQKLLFVRINQVENETSETVAEFAHRLGLAADTIEFDKCIIDIRNNLGGNNVLAIELAEMIATHPQINRPGRLFTMIGRRTYSAGVNLASLLENRTLTLFVGEPTGQGPNHFGDAKSVSLPNSRIPVEISSRRWEGSLPDDARQWIEPEIPIDYTIDDFIQARDPAVDAILAYQHPVLLGADSLLYNPPPLKGRYMLGPYHLVTFFESTANGTLQVTDFSPRSLMTVRSRLYPTGPDTYATDISQVKLLRYQTDGHLDSLLFDWHGVRKPLTKVPEDHIFPLELILSGDATQGLLMLQSDDAAIYLRDPMLENKLNGLGYHHLRAGRTETAIAIFKRNSELFPQSSNVFDSLAEAYFDSGESEKAKESSLRVLELDPGNPNAVQMLDRLD